jgi:hypothetical protein
VKTHASRGAGARQAEIAGATEAQIRRLGNWNSNTMENCYLSNLPRDAMRSLAGFSAKQNDYYLRRAVLEPPISLQKKIFPQVEIAEDNLRSKTIQPSIALGAFLDLLKFFRTVILQDAAILLETENYKSHMVFDSEIFKCEEFLDFKR